MEPVRILHVVHTMNRGGMESRIMDLYRELNKDQFQYDFYIESGKHGAFDNEIIALGGRLFYHKSDRTLNLPDFRAFHEFLEEHLEYKIVYTYNQWAGWYLKEAKRCCVPIRIASSRTCIDTVGLKSLVKNLVKLNVNKYSTHRFAVSEKAAIWLFSEGEVKRGNVNIWPNAIDTQKYAFSDMVRCKIRNELGLGDSYTVMHVGNIRHEKNHSFLLRVFSEIKKMNDDSVLILIGEGKIDHLIPQITELGLKESVKYLGVRTDIPQLLQAGDMFIFPSLYEGFPGAVLEAEASGLACLISDTITREVMLTDNIVSASLEDTPSRWAHIALNMLDIDRKTAWKTIRNANYDIYDLVGRTEKFYSNLADRYEVR